MKLIIPLTTAHPGTCLEYFLLPSKHKLLVADYTHESLRAVHWVDWQGISLNSCSQMRHPGSCCSGRLGEEYLPMHWLYKDALQLAKCKVCLGIFIANLFGSYSYEAFKPK